MKKIFFILSILICGVVRGQSSLQETHRPPTQPTDPYDATRRQIQAAQRRTPTPTPTPVKTTSSTKTETVESASTSSGTAPPVVKPVPIAKPTDNPTVSRISANQQQCIEPPRQYLRELSIFFGEGLSGIYYNINNGGVSKMTTGVNFGAFYTYFMHNNVSISGGVGLAFYNTTAALPTQYSYTKQKSVLNDVDQMYLQRFLSGYVEQQNIMTLNVPVMVTYVSDYKFYARAGFQLGIPMRATYTASNASILQGYQFKLPSGYKSAMIYETFDAGSELIEAGDFHMTPRITDYIDVKLSVILSVEAGLRFEIVPRHYLYTGVFFDFGVNNLVVKNDKDFIRGEAGISYPRTDRFSLNNFSTNSLLNSREFVTTRFITDSRKEITDAPEKPRNAFVNGSHLMSVGLKLTYAFSVVPTVATSSVGTSEAATPWQNISDKLDRLMTSNSSKETTRIERTEIRETAGKNTKSKKVLTKAQRTKFIRTIQRPLMGFTPRQTTLSAEQKNELNRKATALRQMDKEKIVLYGYTSDVGGEATSIGMKRANAVKSYLVKRGVKAGNISVVSRGQENPIAPNTNNENRSKNNRVEFMMK
jgi:outer membrane protein OmpA-like peptidoglycan-associated protein